MVNNEIAFMALGIVLLVVFAGVVIVWVLYPFVDRQRKLQAEETAREQLAQLYQTRNRVRPAPTPPAQHETPSTYSQPSYTKSPTQSVQDYDPNTDK